MTEEITKNPAVKDAPKAVRRSKPFTGEKVKLKILSQEGENGDVFLAVNGHGIQIKRNEEVEVDKAFLHVLNNATIRTTVSDFDANGQRTTKVVEMQRFPYQIVG